jgi:uronate dehydrogenase
MRIGNVNPAPIDKRRLSILFTPRDLAQLVTIGIERPDIRFEIVYGISGNKRAWYDNSNAFRLGYKPQDDSERWAAEVLAKEPAGADPIAEQYQGGVFCVAEEVPNPAPLPKKSRRKAAKRRR